MSGKGHDPNAALAAEQRALGDYFDALLSEQEPETPHLRPVANRPAPLLDMPVLRQIPVAPPPEVQTEIKVEVAAETAAAPARPEWAEVPFQCLLFHVAGLNLAVPLSRLNGVIPWPENVTPMPGHAAHFLGLVEHQERKVRLIDTAAVVMPPERLAAQQRHYGKVILIGEGRWGLACDDVGEVVTLDPDGVRWRSAQGRRQWLAGTVVEHMCALLDTDAMAERLQSGDYDD